MSLYLKWTRKGRVPSYQGGDPIPYRKWTPTVRRPVPCERGWHACRWEDALDHISSELWVCELGGRIVEGDDKVAASSLRLVRKVPLGGRELRLFAADCAERVLPIFEREHPNDPRPREAIRVARLFAEGETTPAELAAARAAAWAAWAAARGAARDAAWAAGDAAGDAARNAAGAAAWAAAEDAAEAWVAAGAAGAAERAWQTDRLLCHYGGLNPDLFARKAAP